MNGFFYPTGAMTSVSLTQAAYGRVDDRVGAGVVEWRVAGDQAVHRRPEDQVDRDLGVALCAQLAPRDTAVPDRPYQFAPRAHEIVAQLCPDLGVELRLADELGIGPATLTGIEMDHPAQRKAEVFARRPRVRIGRLDRHLRQKRLDGHRILVRPPLVNRR